ncbi:MAG TPA: MBL fold metallo-hydrolase [Dehalococcoidia bacterium]|jgi:glyoxylase-like metal-dependent hydrolase (beta-lactamase superfamily II)
MKVMVDDEAIEIIRMELGPWGTNAYVVVCHATDECLLVDAPGEADKILTQLTGTKPKYIAITHSHIDHIGALEELKSNLKIPVAVHPADASRLPFKPDMELKDGNAIKIGKLNIKVLHTPGHTPGSLCFLTGRHLISGDTIFPGGPGKTGSPADFKQIVKSIKDKLFALPDDTQVYPGHGEPTVLGKEKKEFAAFASKSHDPGLCGDVLWLSS